MKNLISVFSLIGMFFLFASTVGQAQTISPSVEDKCATLVEDYLPQATPEATYRQELDMMHEGYYCHDKAIFDAQWRKKSGLSLQSERNKTIAKMFDTTFQVQQNDEYAVIYYTEDFRLGPVFLQKTDQGWIIDRTSTLDNIIYSQTWMAKDGQYPYLELLKQVYILQKGRSGSGVSVYQPLSKG